MSIIIEVYFVLCVALLVFDLVFLVVKNHRADAFAPRRDAFADRLAEELQRRRQTGSFSEAFADELPRALAQTRHLMSAQREMEQSAQAEQWLREAVWQQVTVYAARRDEERAYYAYVLSTMDYDAQAVPTALAGELLEFLQSDSLYVFCNTMDAFYRFGEVHLLLAALQCVEKRGEFYHKKLLVDGLLGARGDRAALQAALLERFDRSTPPMQCALLDYFRMSGADVRELCERLIISPQTQTEVRRSAMRALASCAGDSSRELFLALLCRDDVPWVEQMLAIDGLRQWGDEQTRRAVTAKLGSEEWNVRVHAAEYLRRHGAARALAELARLQDRYAAEQLCYRCREAYPAGEEICV